MRRVAGNLFSFSCLFGGITRTHSLTTQFVVQRYSTTDFYNRYYYPPPTILSHTPGYGDTSIMPLDSLDSALSHMTQLPARDLFVVVFLCGKQHKITVDDFILVTQIHCLEVFSEIYLEKVLLIGSVNWSLIGTPIIPKGMVKVKATVLEHKLTEPLIVFKMKKHNYKKTNIHRSLTTLLQIQDIFVEPTFQVNIAPAIHPEDGLRSLNN